ncbi:MAG TPA: hypothetical protein VHV31_14140 [Nitrolancea sp.]|jgi:hypothetical protein|nr:hypothetical protein [Nitrolancea sp.]
MLFDHFERINGNPAEHGESLYSFLNRAAGEQWQSVRDVLSEWLSHYPEGEQSTLISRFRRTDRRGFLGAFWELYLHDLFRRLGFEIALHPEVSGTTHRPDFRLQRGSAHTYVEAVTIFEPQPHSIEDARMAPVIDAINSISSPVFHLAMEAYSIGAIAPPANQLCQTVDAWIQGLDVSAESWHPSNSSGVLRWQYQGWDLQFTPIPRSPKDRGLGASPTLGVHPERRGMIDDHRAIRQRLGEKTRAYGRQLRAPLVIALISYRHTTDFDELLAGLFGAAYHHPEMIRDGAIHRSRWGSSNGFWLTNKGVEYDDASAVLTAFELMPWSVARRQPWLISNPWASQRLEIELPFNRVVVDTTTGIIERVETDFQPQVHFGLPPDWPNDSAIS